MASSSVASVSSPSHILHQPYVQTHLFPFLSVLDVIHLSQTCHAAHPLNCEVAKPWFDYKGADTTKITTLFQAMIYLQFPFQLGRPPFDLFQRLDFPRLDPHLSPQDFPDSDGDFSDASDSEPLPKLQRLEEPPKNSIGDRLDLARRLICTGNSTLAMQAASQLLLHADLSYIGGDTHILNPTGKHTRDFLQQLRLLERLNLPRPFCNYERVWKDPTQVLLAAFRANEPQAYRILAPLVSAFHKRCSSIARDPFSRYHFAQEGICFSLDPTTLFSIFTEDASLNFIVPTLHVLTQIGVSPNQALSTAIQQGNARKVALTLKHMKETGSEVDSACLQLAERQPDQEILAAVRAACGPHN